MIERVHIKQFQNERIFWILSVICFGLCILYGYFVNTAILHAVSRQKAQVTLSHLNSQIGDMEATYLALKSSVNLDSAYAMGFKDADPVFINRTSLGLNR